MTAASAARNAKAQSTPGDTRTRNSVLAGRSPGLMTSVDDVLGEPLAPFRGLLGAQLVIDDDRLFAPLIRGREYARQLGDGRIDLGVEDDGAALLELGDLGLHRGIQRGVDELVGELRPLGAFHDGDCVDAEHGTSFGIASWMGTPS